MLPTVFALIAWWLHQQLHHSLKNTFLFVIVSNISRIADGNVNILYLEYLFLGGRGEFSQQQSKDFCSDKQKAYLPEDQKTVFIS